MSKSYIHYSIFALCDYILDTGIESFEQVTIKELKDFLQSEKHTSFVGYASRVGVVRQFILYLEEYKVISSKGLHLGLTSGVAKEVNIVDVLSDEEIELIYDYRKKAASTMELRNSAMVLLGLRMVLPYSEDI